MASALLGCMAGPLLGGTLSDRWGRKPTLIFAGLLFAAGSIGSAMPTNILEFDLFRFLGGVGVGLASVVSPMFIAEVSPPRIRGALVTVNQLAIVVGLACAVVVSYFLSFGEHWRWMLASNAVPVPIFIVGLLFVPESPRWMAQRDRQEEAIERADADRRAATCRVRNARDSGVRPRTGRVARTVAAGDAIRHAYRLLAGRVPADHRRKHFDNVHAHGLSRRPATQPIAMPFS